MSSQSYISSNLTKSLFLLFPIHAVPRNRRLTTRMKCYKKATEIKMKENTNEN